MNQQGVQTPTNAAELEQALKNRLEELKLMFGDDAVGRDIDSMKALKAADIKVNSESIKFSDDGKTITITGPFFSKAAFLVAKGAKTANYSTPFNITLVKANFAPNQTGSIKNDDKIAKIQIYENGNVQIVNFQ